MWINICLINVSVWGKILSKAGFYHNLVDRWREWALSITLNFSKAAVASQKEPNGWADLIVTTCLKSCYSWSIAGLRTQGPLIIQIVGAKYILEWMARLSRLARTPRRRQPRSRLEKTYPHLERVWEDTVQEKIVFYVTALEKKVGK